MIGRCVRGVIGAAKDWKRTVKHAGQCIKALLAHRLLSIDTEPVGCVCKHCTTAAAADAAVRCHYCR